jgi:phosphoribosyl 1,2-cyclic phosphodiesterase
MAFSIKIISSGSKANCTYITDGKTHLLIDCGLSFSELKKRADSANIDLDLIDAVLITHEHIDHIKGLPVFTHKTEIPFYCNNLTYQAIAKYYDVKNHKDINNFEQGFIIKSIGIQPFRINHDAIYPMGYSLYTEGDKCSLVTDTGCVNKSIINNICGSKTLLLESNHDEQMLINGRYPLALKKRILSDNGHLCNAVAAEVIANMCSEKTENVALCHLSEENNTPEIAYNTTFRALKIRGINDINITVASQYDVVKVKTEKIKSVAKI